jgi:acetyl-CoA C-acetyltransferase
VTQTGDQGANIARISALYSGLPDRVSGGMVNRFCTSGLDAVVDGAAQVATGMAEHVWTGGIESMSRVPIFSDKGAWFADPDVAVRTRFVQMGFAADVVATLAGLERAELDAYAAESHRRAARATEEGRFAASIVEVAGLSRDELIRPETTVEGMADLAPLFADDRSSAAATRTYSELEHVNALHHRGNSPSLADGAAIVVVASQAGLNGAAPRARIRSWARASMEPVAMLTACEQASRKALERAGMSAADVDLWEVNEAFAAVPVKMQRDFDIDPERFNPNGGTIAMGHAMGATGAMLVITALDELERSGKTTALVAISGGAGLGSAMVIEKV